MVMLSFKYQPYTKTSFIATRLHKLKDVDIPKQNILQEVFQIQYLYTLWILGLFFYTKNRFLQDNLFTQAFGMVCTFTHKTNSLSCKW